MRIHDLDVALWPGEPHGGCKAELVCSRPDASAPEENTYLTKIMTLQAKIESLEQQVAT